LLFDIDNDWYDCSHVISGSARDPVDSMPMRRGLPAPTADGIGDSGIGGVVDPTVPWEAMGHHLETGLAPKN
jgi:hypothetical protein